jgi:hypothetical protein
VGLVCEGQATTIVDSTTACVVGDGQDVERTEGHVTTVQAVEVAGAVALVIAG